MMQIQALSWQVHNNFFVDNKPMILVKAIKYIKEHRG